jgi:hypothetical protein
MATYYISSSSGSSSANGLSSLTPWQTLKYACDHTVSGDVIHVMQGTFTETLKCSLKPGVSIIGEGYLSHIVAGFIGAYDEPDDVWEGVIDLNSSSLTNGNQSISNIRIDGNNYYGKCAIMIYQRSNVEVKNCWFEKFQILGYCNNNEKTAPPAVYAVGSSVHDCTFSSCSQSGIPPIDNGGNIRIKGNENFQVYNNILDATARTDHKNGENLSIIFTKGLKIYNNKFYKNNEETGGHTWNFQAEIFHTIGGCEIYNNEFYGCATFDFVGLFKGDYPFSLKMHNNTFTVASNVAFSDTGHTYTAINLEDQGVIEYVYVYNNHIKNFPYGVSVYGAFGTEPRYNPWLNFMPDVINVNNINIYYNLFENIGWTNNANDGINGTAIALIGDSLNGSPPTWHDINIYNNVMTGNGMPNFGMKAILEGTYNTINIKNNIIKGFVSSPIAFAKRWSATLDLLNISNNIWYLNGINQILFTGIAPTRYTPINNITTNPLFTTDFHLQADSLAIDKGLDVGLNLDFGNNVVGVPPCIGVYEFNGTVPVENFQIIIEKAKLIKWGLA